MKVKSRYWPAGGTRTVVTTGSSPLDQTDKSVRTKENENWKKRSGHMFDLTLFVFLFLFLLRDKMDDINRRSGLSRR